MIINQNVNIMTNKLLKFAFLLVTSFSFAQAGHLMQGVGAVNMSMGGAATAQPLDISGAMQWNPASLSVFSGKNLKFDIGAFFSSPELYSSLPEGAMWPADAFFPGSPASPATGGSIEDQLGTSVMPALAFAWGDVDSKHTFGISAFGISGFGVDFPEETNLPANADGSPNADWDPTNSSPISYPQSLRGFGRIKSGYMLLQVSFTWAYEFSDKFSIGVQPNFNYEALELSPNPLANPSMTAGYPKSDKASAVGIGGQIGLFYDSQNGFKAGASYKSPQFFGEFDFNNTYLDGSTGTNTFTMNYPAIYSVGVGYSKGNFDLALDYRMVDYDGTEGFEKTGWTNTASIQGFGWKDISIVSVGIQYKGIEKLPLRLGYTYSSNPIDSELAMFSVPATAVIANAFQFGLSYDVNESFTLDGVYHYGMSNGKTSGNMLNPQAIAPGNPLGKIPGSVVAYDMTTSMIQVGLRYKFGSNKTTEVIEN